MSDEKRAYVASHFAIELEKEVHGFLRSVEGGGIKAEVLTHQSGPNQDLWRYIGRPKYEDITFQVGMGMSKKFYEWIHAFFRQEVVRKSGAVIAADFGYYERTRRTFTEAIITEVAMPGVDGASKEACYMTVKLAPEGLSYGAGTNEKLKAEDLGTKKSFQKKWVAANFRFTLLGLEPALVRVQKVDAYTIKQQVIEYPSGPRRFPVKVPGKIEYPNMTFYIPEVDSGLIVQALGDRLDRNKPKIGSGITGALVYTGSDGKDLCTVGLSGVDVVSIEPEKFEASSENIHRVKIQIHVEKMSFKYAEGAVG